jgi:hypothetical protein
MQEQNEKDRKYLAILDWFSAAQSTTADHESFREIRTPYAGSGRWILKHEKIQNWREMDTPVSSILWVNGIPGAGMPPPFMLLDSVPNHALLI